VGYGEGCPLPTGKGPGGGYAPSPEKFQIFGVKMTCFDAFLALFLITEYSS